MDALIALMSV